MCDIRFKFWMSEMSNREADFLKSLDFFFLSIIKCFQNIFFIFFA